jgi:hypothetical protein
MSRAQHISSLPVDKDVADKPVGFSSLFFQIKSRNQTARGTVKVKHKFITYLNTTNLHKRKLQCLCDKNVDWGKSHVTRGAAG